MKKTYVLKNENGDILEISERVVPNKMHFEVQLNNRMTKTSSKKAFKRSREKRELNKILKDYE